MAGILDDGASLSEAGEGQAVAQAFQALVRHATRRTAARSAGEAESGSEGGRPVSTSHSDDDGVPGAEHDILALATELVGHGAAVQVIEELLQAPNGEGATELITVVAAFPDRMIAVLDAASVQIADPSVQQSLARIRESVRAPDGRTIWQQR